MPRVSTRKAAQASKAAAAASTTVTAPPKKTKKTKTATVSQVSAAAGQDTGPKDPVLDMLRQITTRLSSMDDELKKVKQDVAQGRAHSDEQPSTSAAVSSASSTQPQVDQQTAHAQVSQATTTAALSPPPKRARKEGAGSPVVDVAELVRTNVAKRFREVGIKEAPQEHPIDPSDSEEEDSDHSPVQRTRGKQLKSGRALNANNQVSIKLKWPHYSVYDRDGNPADYDKLSIPQFVKGYSLASRISKQGSPAVMAEILEDIMEDAEMYPWPAVRACHAIFLQKIENRSCKWTSHEERHKLRRTHVWSQALLGSSRATLSPRRQRSAINTTPATTIKSGQRFCSVYNKATCTSQDEHPRQLHACSYCARVTSMAYKHPEKACRRRQKDDAKQQGN